MGTWASDFDNVIQWNSRLWHKVLNGCRQHYFVNKPCNCLWKSYLQNLLKWLLELILQMTTTRGLSNQDQNLVILKWWDQTSYYVFNAWQFYMNTKSINWYNINWKCRCFKKSHLQGRLNCKIFESDMLALQLVWENTLQQSIWVCFFR